MTCWAGGKKCVFKIFFNSTLFFPINLIKSVHTSIFRNIIAPGKKKTGT